MAGIKFANNVATTTTSAINAAVTTIPVASIAGFPTQTGGDYFYATLAPAVEYTTSVREIVKVTDWTTTSLTVTRGQDGTDGASWPAGSKFEIRLPKIVLESFVDTSAIADMATKTGTETLTNKTLTTPIADSLTLTDGQLVFPATQNASTDANTLDDYQEGTYTPVVSFDTPGNLSVAYAQQVGEYTKIGDTVYFNVSLTFTPTYSTASGILSITLPFNHNVDKNYIFSTYVTRGGFSPAGIVDLVAHSSTGVGKEGIARVTYFTDTTQDFLRATYLTSGTAYTIRFSGHFKAT